MRECSEKEKAKGMLQGVPAVRPLRLGEQCFNRKCVKLPFFCWQRGWKWGLLSKEFPCVNNVCKSVWFLITGLCRCPWVHLGRRLKKKPLNIEIYATFRLQWYREYREQSITKPIVHFVFCIHSLSLIKCSMWETYVSSGKPTSFCSSHWTGSLSLTRIPHFKDFHGKDFRLRMSFSVLLHYQSRKLLHIKCVDLIID